MAFDPTTAKEVGGFDISSAIEDGESGAPQSRWQAIKKQSKETLSEEIKKHPDFPEYQKYLETAKKAHKSGGFSKPGDIPGAEHPLPEIADFNTWRRTRGDPLAWAGAGIGTAVDVGLATAGGLWDVTGGLAKGMLSGKSAEESMRDPTYIPKTDAGEWIMQKMGEALPAMPTMHIPSKSRTAKAQAEREASRKRVESVVPEPQPVPKPVPVEDLPPTQLELPLSTSPEAIAERRAVGTGQPDLFFSDQANMDAMGNGAIAEAQARARAAQAAVDAQRQEASQQALMARQQALEAEVASRVGEEQIARRRTDTLAQGADALRRTDSGYEQFLAQQEAEAGAAAGRRPLLQHQDTLDFTPHGDRPAQFGMTDIGGRVDEHGIPIRADLSMEAQNLQNPLQRNLWGDELPGRTGDGGLPLTRALDKMPPGPERARAIGSLSGAGDIGRALEDAEIAKRSGVGVGGPRGAQRGAIDVRAVKEALDQLKKGIIRGPDALRAFVGTFDAQMDHSDISKGIGGGHIGWFPAIKNSRDLKSEGRLVWMSPADFHTAALPRFMDSTKPNGIGERKRQSIRIGINEEAGLSSIPVLRLNEMGKIIGHEGRHRMDVMRELGVSKAPVYLHTHGHTNADGPIPHLSMISEDGNKKVPIPESIFPMGNDPLKFTPNTPVGQSGIGRNNLVRGAADFGIMDGIRKRMKEVDDIVATVQTALPPKAQDIVSNALKEARDGRGIDSLEAGGVMTAAKRNSSLIRDVVRVKQHYMAAAERVIRDVVFPYEKAVRSLSRQELTDLSSVLKKEMFAGQEVSMKALADAGFSEKQLLAYQKLRTMTNAAWEQQNAARVAAGEKPLTKLEAYLNSQWQGTHRRAIKDGNGRTVWFLASDSKARLEHDTKALLKKFPDLQPEAPFIAQKSRGGNDLHQIYATMLKVMGDDPAFQSVKSWYEGQMVDTASGALGQERFFDRKYNVRGFIGDRPLTMGRTEFSESLGMLQTQANYAKSAFKWTALQEANKHLKDVFASKDLQAQQPNNMAYAKKYFMHQFGANESTWIKAMEDALDKSIPGGITSSNQISRGIGTMKALWTAQKLAFNLGYAAANVFQLPQAIPYMTDIQVKYGGNPVTGLAIGTTFGPILAAQHQLNPLGVGLHKMLAAIPDKGMRTFLAQAMKYAEDNQIILSSAADEAPIAKSFGALAAVKRISDKSIAVPDSLRSVAFMTFATQLYSTGKMDAPSALRLAHEYTVRSMVDFREGERAMAFDKMGMVGNAANTLQSYSVNYFQQWNWAAREVLRKNPLPFIAMLGVQGAVGGAMGLPFFSSIDKGLEWLKDQVKETSPLLWKKIRDFSLSDLVLKTGGESMLYGAASKNPADVSIASRVTAPAVEEMLQLPTAPATDLAGTLASVGKAVMDPTNPQKAAQAAYNVAPSGVQGYLETGPLQDFLSSPAEDGRIVRRPKDMADPTGMFFRSEADAGVRKWGLRSQSEVFRRDQAYKASKQEQDSREVLAKLPKRIYNAAKTNNSDLADYITMYVEMTPGIKTQKDVQRALNTMFENQILRENTTSIDRLVTGKATFESVMAYKRFQEAMKRAGYTE